MISSLQLLVPCCWGTKKTIITNIFPFPGGGLGSQNPARTIALSPPGVEETLNYCLREKYRSNRQTNITAWKQILILNSVCFCDWSFLFGRCSTFWGGGSNFLFVLGKMLYMTKNFDRDQECCVGLGLVCSELGSLFGTRISVRD